MKKLILILFVSGSFSTGRPQTVMQKQTGEIRPSPLSGTWIEEVNKADSLVFLPMYDGQNPIFRLQRGFDSIDGYWLPGHLSGPYWYKLEKDRISISWLLSSDSRYHPYYFRISDDKATIKIGNFFDDKRSGKDTLIFIRNVED